MLLMKIVMNKLLLFSLIMLGVTSIANCEEQYSKQEVLRFIVLGDWGTPGAKGQKLVAQQMDKVAANVDIDFIATTGDNFYMKGVQSIDDPLWENSFENIYSLPNIKDIPWYVSLGNHDHMGNLYAQIDYAKEHTNWILPDTYYSKVLKINENSDLRILFLDTSPFIEEYRSTPDYYPNLMKQDRQTQVQWLEDTLSNTDNTWNIAIGHHPVYSVGPHGDSEELKNILPELFERQQLDAYFAGHDHHLEHHHLVGRTHHFISGGGSRIRGISKRKNRQFAASSLGFALVTVDANCMQVSFINEKGKQLYRTVNSLTLEAVCQ
jgi:tartrate-resistant acid phosphatase type 5